MPPVAERLDIYGDPTCPVLAPQVSTGGPAGEVYPKSMVSSTLEFVSNVLVNGLGLLSIAGTVSFITWVGLGVKPANAGWLLLIATT